MNRPEYKVMYEVEDTHWWYTGLHELILATVRKESQRLGRPLKIFDAGCGTGRLCQLLYALGHDVSGCDVSEEALLFCRERGISNVYLADLNTVELAKDSFDIITSIDVLYHEDISDDVAVMTRLRDALKPGGMLIQNLVAFEFLRSTHDLAVRTRERYTRDMLCRRLKASGLETVSITYRLAFIFPLIAVYRFVRSLFMGDGQDVSGIGSDLFLPPCFINSFLLSVLRLENRLMRIFPLPVGTSLFSVATRAGNDH